LDWVAQTDEGENEYDTSWGGNILGYNNYLWNVRYSHQNENWNNQVSVNSSRDQNFTFGNGVAKADAEIFETRRQQFSYLANNKITDELTVGGGVDWLQDNVEKSTTNYSETERTTQSAFINANYISDSFLAELALRYDDVENVADDTAINIGLGYRFNQYHQLSINYGEGFKAPSFNDLYFPWGGNPDLRFETSDNQEIVYKGFYETGNLVASVYESQVENLIQWIPDNNGIWAPQNVGKADISGIDVSFDLRLTDFHHKITASYVDAEDATTGTQLIRRAKKHLGYDLSYIADTFDWFMQVQYVGERPDTGYQSFMPIMLDSYTQVNFAASYTFNNQWQLKLKITDAFDKAPTLVSGYNAAGRQYSLTLIHQNLF